MTGKSAIFNVIFDDEMFTSVPFANGSTEIHITKPAYRTKFPLPENTDHAPTASHETSHLATKAERVNRQKSEQ